MWPFWIACSERGWVPDFLLRIGIRHFVRARLAEVEVHDPTATAAREASFLENMATAPIAPVPEKANEQHYEVPAEFFRLVLGPNLKYSCCYWDGDTRSLAEAEENALRITCERAELRDGMRVLDLGCGWGSLTLWIARNYPQCEVDAVTNSRGQADWIRRVASGSDMRNVRVHRADMNQFDVADTFDRIFSIEMFEHMRNWPRLFRKVRSWVRPDGRFFLHTFAHRSVPYEYVSRSAADWMSQYFFTGGMMPSDTLPILCAQEDWHLVRRWRWAGEHYRRTCRAWLERMDSHEAEIMPLFAATYGQPQARIWWHRWRIFFLACAETFGFRGGSEYWVGHWLFAPRV